MSAQPAVGFIGLGSQGAPMARRIVEAGFSTLLWARRPESLEPYRDTAAEYAASLAELAARVDVLCLCVVDDAGVREVVDAALPVMASGSVLVIHSTIHPDSCKTIAATAAERGVAVIDAPVSGGATAAEAGTLTVMAGGAEAAFAQVRPVLESFAGTIVHLGPVGAGQLAKLVNNAMMIANMAVGDAALKAADSLGIDPAALAELVKVSSGRSFGFDVRARISDPAQWGHGAALLAKDLGLLGALLPGDSGYLRLEATARPFLSPLLAQDHTP
jgi:3-hydroxyisobutyrate dehydrogenase-like beta-hydroxyacid dehydrogenase